MIMMMAWREIYSGILIIIKFQQQTRQQSSEHLSSKKEGENQVCVQKKSLYKFVQSFFVSLRAMVGNPVLVDSLVQSAR